jgi:hypothetical protein
MNDIMWHSSKPDSQHSMRVWVHSEQWYSMAMEAQCENSGFDIVSVRSGYQGQ